jgi:hypothetical protein
MKLRSALVLILIFAFASIAHAQKRGIRKVDFKNYDYGALCGGPHKFLALTGDTLVLKNGRAEQGDEMNYTDLESIKYIDLDGDGSEEAFIVNNGQTTGSSGGYVAAYVFCYKNRATRHHWTKCEENSTADLIGRTITFTSPEWIGADAHCCFRFIRTETLTMRRGKMVVIRTKRRRTDSAKIRGRSTVAETALATGKQRSTERGSRVHKKIGVDGIVDRVVRTNSGYDLIKIGIC